jgi:hypothetical protein
MRLSLFNAPLGNAMKLGHAHITFFSCSQVAENEVKYVGHLQPLQYLWERVACQVYRFRYRARYNRSRDTE